MLDLRALIKSIRNAATSDTAAQVVASKLPRRVVFWTVAHALREVGLEEFAHGKLKPFLLRLSPEPTPELDDPELEPTYRVLIVAPGPASDVLLQHLRDLFPGLTIERQTRSTNAG